MGRLFGKGRQIEALLKKAEEAFGSKNWASAASIAKDLRLKIEPKDSSKFPNELMRAYYLEASSLHKLYKTQEALVLIENALEFPHKLADIARLLSEIAEESNDPAIIPILEKAEQKLPDNNYVALALATKYVEVERFDEKTFPLFNRMHQKAPENRKVIYGLAMTLRKLERFDRTTLAIYRKAFQEYSTNNDFLYALAKTYASQNPPVNEALPIIERALKFYPEEKAFYNAKIVILANLPALTPEQVRILVEHFKKTKDEKLAEKLVDHLLLTHADDESACRVYEAVWKDHPKRLTILSILAERYRLAGRRDPDAMEVFQAFFDEMPRERDNTIYLAKQYAASKADDKKAVLVYQQALKEGETGEIDEIVIALAGAYLKMKRADEEAARIYRMAHTLEPENFDFLAALKDVALHGGRIDGSRANPLIDYVSHSGAPQDEVRKLASKLGPSLAKENRSDADAARVYAINLLSGVITEPEEELLAKSLIDRNAIKITDIPLLERIYKRKESDEVGAALVELYRQSGEMNNERLSIVIRMLRRDLSNRQLATWALPFLLNDYGQDANYFPLIGDLISRGYLTHAKNIKPGVVAATATRIGRDRIREGKFKEAIEVLSEAFKFDPNPILQYLLGVSYQGAGDLQTGLSIFKRLQKADIDNPVYKYRIAVLKMMSGEYADAEKDLAYLEGRYPDHPLVLLRKGMIHEVKGDHEGALQAYAKVKSREKVIAAFADYRIGILLCMEGKWEEGIKRLDQAYAGGVKLPNLEMTRLIARTILADSAMQTGALDEAERLLQPLLETKTPPWALVVNERLLRLAIYRLKASDEKGAQRALERAEKSGARDSRVSSLLALIDMSNSRPKAALERLERSLTGRDVVGTELAHRLWAVISLRLGKYEEAREAADWLIARDVQDAEKIRFLTVWRNPVEVDWPPALNHWTYEDLEKIGFPIGLIGRLAYKRADYEEGAKFLEKYYKDSSKPDRTEAEFLLGLMYIKLKKANLGLHYWSQILSDGYRELSGKQRIDALMLLGYQFLEHGQPDKAREAFNLAHDAGSSEEEFQRAMALSHLQAGYLEAKSDHLHSAIREWEKILENSPNDWRALQNLAIAYFWINDDSKALMYFDKLFVVAEENPESIDPADLTFLKEETRRMINQIIGIKQMEQTRSEVKREMMLDEIQEANRHYWTLGVKKGATSEEAQAQYFRLVKIYNPEKYPEDFMILERAYEFFNKPGLLKKNEQKVFNAFHFKLLNLQQSEGLPDIPPSPQIIEYLKKELDPKNQVNLEFLLADSYQRKDVLPVLNSSVDFACPDYLIGW